MDIFQLKQAGVNYYEGVQRFGGNKDVYEYYLNKIFQTNSMEQLQILLNNYEYVKAYHIAHDLKGTSSNLSMNVFYVAICALSDELSTGTPKTDVMVLYEKAYELYQQAKKAAGCDVNG